MTKGYKIINFEEMDDYIFFIYRGTCKILYPTEQIKENIAFGGIIDEDK